MYLAFILLIPFSIQYTYDPGIPKSFFKDKKCDDRGSFSFFNNEHLKELGLINLTSIACYDFSILYNSMNTLNLPKLKVKSLNSVSIPSFQIIKKPGYRSKDANIWLSEDSSEFCLKTEEMDIFMENIDVNVATADVKYCQPLLTDKMCKETKEGCIGMIGNVEIGPDTDLNAFKTVERIYGNLVINGTEIRDLGFLKSLEYVTDVDPGGPIIIENNPNLVNITFPKLKKIRGEIHFNDNNEVLASLPKYCKALSKSMNIDVGKILVDGMGCDDNLDFGVVTWEQNSQLLELGFLNLTSISCAMVDISANVNLKRLNMPNLKTMLYPPVMNYFMLLDNSPNLCVTTDEMAVTFDIYDHFTAKYCEPVFNDKLCKEPRNGCTELIGEVEIGPNTDLEAFKTIERIYGTLIIRGTDIEDFEFLESLQYVAALEAWDHAILVIDTPNLINVTFPKLQKVRAEIKDFIKFCYVNETISLEGLYNELEDYTEMEYYNITVNSDRCSGYRNVSSEDSSTRYSIPLIIMIIALSYEFIIYY
uniref:Recep_L_domain domain-containing protein n=1 Tax=Caenorhabditis tropicalis TaxID=1561998 RepID=A0A1I7UEP9_9PELO